MFNSTLASEYTLKAPAFAVERQRAAVLVACLARLVSEVWTVHFISLQSLRFWTAHFSHLCSLSRVPGQKKKKEKEIWCRLTDLVFLVEEAMCSFSSQRLCAAIRWECKIQAMTPMWCCFFFFCIVLAKILQTWQRVVNAAVQGVLQNNECALHSSLVLTDSALRIDSS